jgi:hypothetical protein
VQRLVRRQRGDGGRPVQPCRRHGLDGVPQLRQLPQLRVARRG